MQRNATQRNKINRNQVECNGEPRIKLSEEITKVTLPGRKRIYRLYGGPSGTTPLVDYMTMADEDPPVPIPNNDDDGILCRDPFRSQHRIKVFPKRVKQLQSVVFEQGRVVRSEEDAHDENDTNDNTATQLSKTRDYVKQQLCDEFPEEVTRYKDPTKYDVMVSPTLYNYLHELWEKNAPVPVKR